MLVDWCRIHKSSATRTVDSVECRGAFKVKIDVIAGVKGLRNMYLTKETKSDLLSITVIKVDVFC